jgi:demethylmenaquinone methyltransferase/2-methoxy-6-polyprenyl-1,4-benzoquinol methylase
MHDDDRSDAPHSADGLYAALFVQRLFNEMSATYGLVNLLTSFGFSARWRRQCVELANIVPGQFVCDLMSGMGELWPLVGRRQGAGGSITAVDFSQGMCDRARMTAERIRRRTAVAVLQKDALDSGLPDASVDTVVCSFGLKTLTMQQQCRLAQEVARMLKPNGRISFLEISVPQGRVLRWFYMFYLKRVIPVLGKLLMGNPDNYRLLGRYTEAFGNARGFADACGAAGLQVTHEPLFFGCASAVVGSKATKAG